METLKFSNYQHGSLNLAQTLIWITNQLGGIADRYSILQTIDRLESSRLSGDPPMLRAFCILQTLKGPEGQIEVPFRDGNMGTSIATIIGASVSVHWEAANKRLLHAADKGAVSISGRRLGAIDAKAELIGRLDCARIMFIDNPLAMSAYPSPRAVYQDNFEEYWDMLCFEAGEIFKLWPLDGSRQTANVDLERLFREEANQRNQPLTQTEAIEIARQAGAVVSRDKIRKALRSAQGQGKPGPKGPRKNRAAPSA